jgi:hypothetical protein
MTHNRVQTINILLLVGAGKLPRVTGAPTSPAFTLCAVSSFVSEGADPSTMSWHSFYKSWLKVWLFASWSPAQELSRRSCRMSSHFQDVVALLSLGPSFRCHLPITPDVCSRTSILSWFLLLDCPWSNFSVISFRPSVLYNNINSGTI